MFSWLCFFLVLTVIILILKIILLYKGMEEIGGGFDERLNGDDTNNVIYVSGNDRHLKALADRLNKNLEILYDRRRRYENGDRELKEAVTNISHDLRTPLTAIYGYLELLESVQEPESIKHYLTQLRNRADALKALTEELFRYSVILSVREENREEVILNRVLEDIMLSYYDIFRQKGIEPAIRICSKAVVRQTDAGALHRILNNILDNAVKYGGHDLEVTLSPEGTMMFRNDAPGLDRVSAGRLFDRFYTVETGRNSTGLGLSIAKLLTERMGGSISAEYEDGKLGIKIKI